MGPASTLRGQLAYHRSGLDGELQPLALCATDDGSEPLPLIVELSPGSIADLRRSVTQCGEIARYAREAGERCLVVKPGQRGPGSVAQGPAEVDVLEAIEWACAHFGVDRDRISLLGGSMGGAAAWYLASHYPDLFAAAAPFAGYCDYELWTKPGGHIMRTHPWERFSWESRDAAYRLDNLSNMALWITHGEWDTSIGGGVSVEHSRRAVARLRELGADVRYTEVSRCGHGSMNAGTLPPVVAWLCRQRRRECPELVRLVSHTLRHHRAYWVAVEQLERYGEPSEVVARRDARELVVTTRNVRRLSLGPLPRSTSVGLTVDTTRFESLDLSSRLRLEREGGRWRSSGEIPAGEKRTGASGPAGDLLYAPHRFVFGSAGDGQEAFLLDWLSQHVPGYFKKHNGGVHRGVFDGESWHELPVRKDTELTDEELGSCNIVLYGSPDSNGVLRRFRDRIPVELGATGIEIAGRAFEGRSLGYFAVFPHPLRPEGYMAVVGGNSAEGLAGSSHLNLELLPDYIVWRDSEAWWGHFGNSWRAQDQ